MGVQWTGTGGSGNGSVPEQLRIVAAIAAHDPTVLNDAERATIACIVQKFSGRGAGPIGKTGVVSNDVKMAAQAVEEVRANVEHNAQVAGVYGSFWDKQLESMQSEIK